jgi:HAMP domain-containing protein
VIALTLANALYAFWRDAQMQRRELEIAEEKQTLAIADLFRDPVMSGDWETVQHLLKHLNEALKNSRLRITSPGGELLADNQGVWQKAPVSAEKMPLVETVDGEKIWLSQHGTLQVKGLIKDENGLVLAVLIKETDYQARFAQLTRMNWTRMVSYLGGILLILSIILLANWKLFLDPLTRIYRIATLVQQGNRKLYMPDSSVLELQRIATAFNAMIDHLEGQQAELETLNRNLEATVAERTTALEASNIAIRKRADQLETINGLIASTAGAMNMQSLAGTALQVIVHTLQADIGGLQIGEVSAHYGIQRETAFELYKIAIETRLNEKSLLVIPDW